MGKQSRLKAERKVRREEQVPDVEAWSQIPDVAISGLCRQPTCALVHCTDPWVTKLELHNAQYSGTLVLVCYSVFSPTDDVETYLRVNGEEFGVLPSGQLHREDPEAHEAAMKQVAKALEERFGAGVMVAFVRHATVSPQVQESQRKVRIPGAQA